ncbi:MAG: type II secretion system protein [Microlunatus sp.]|nr:type II secretion system protein [Microlunatus sp.]
MTALALACAGLAGWLWIEPADPVRRRLVESRRRRSEQPHQRGGRALVVALALAAVIALAVFGGPEAAAVGLAVSIAGATVIHLIAQAQLTHREHARRTEVANGCSVIANQVRVGRIPSEALTLAAVDAPVLEIAARIQRNGGDVVATLTSQAREPGCQGLRDLARAWQVGVRTGAPMADLLDQVALALRADQAVERTVTAELAGPRATGRVMAVLPLCGVGLGYLLGGNPVRFLLDRPIGWACLVGGVGLAAAGAVWIDWLARQVGSHR